MVQVWWCGGDTNAVATIRMTMPPDGARPALPSGPVSPRRTTLLRTVLTRGTFHQQRARLLSPHQRWLNCNHHTGSAWHWPDTTQLDTSCTTMDRLQEMKMKHTKKSEFKLFRKCTNFTSMLCAWKYSSTCFYHCKCTIDFSILIPLSRPWEVAQWAAVEWQFINSKMFPIPRTITWTGWQNI